MAATIDVRADTDAVRRLRQLEHKVEEAERAVREAEEAKRAAVAREKALRADLTTAFAAQDEQRVQAIRDELRTVGDEFLDERVEGARLALAQARANVEKYIGHSYDALIRAHAPRCHAARGRIDKALRDYQAAVQEFAACEQITVRLLTGAGRGTGRDVPSLGHPFVSLGQEIRRLPEVPTPLPATAPPVDTVTPPSSPRAWHRVL